MKMKLYNDGTADIIKDGVTMRHTYVLDEGQDRTIYSIEMSDAGEKVERAPKAPPAPEPEPMSTSTVMVGAAASAEAGEVTPN